MYFFFVFDKNLQIYYCLYLMVLMSQITTVCTEHFTTRFGAERCLQGKYKGFSFVCIPSAF